MIENRVSGYLYNELFSKSNEENVWSFKVWLGPLLFMKILSKTAQLPSKHFPSGFSFFIFYFFFYEGKDTSAIPQARLSILYMFLLFL